MRLRSSLRSASWHFFAWPQHLFSSIVTIFDPGEEPTDADIHKMDLIDKELQKFA